ncbi:hypothetical protein U7230_08320 [Carboxydochorda subterranea]|uniref:Uncharacterized protein n=1 Tax=Carboxydichorda subterranea TaxID=3109565 RepID=A0ABZ1BTK2_9FIRM|nr:hypothetical protein [Limnochorda sp. L945t]WRP16112.1 hypothetical protein U7230_08320 [Limnochorda sp. L945t]
MNVRRSGPRWMRWLVTGMALSLMALPAVHAQQPPPSGPAPQVPAEPSQPSPADPRASAVDQLKVALDQVSEENISGKSDRELGQVAQSVVNVLEGSSGEHFNAEVANPGDGTGAIVYLEQVTGRKASDFPEDQLESMATSSDHPPEVQALVHVLMADSLLTGAPVTADTVLLAADHLNEALGLLESGATTAPGASGSGSSSTGSGGSG